MSFSFSCLWIW